MIEEIDYCLQVLNCLRSHLLLPIDKEAREDAEELERALWGLQLKANLAGSLARERPGK